MAKKLTQEEKFVAQDAQLTAIISAIQLREIIEVLRRSKRSEHSEALAKLEEIYKDLVKKGKVRK